ncbi:hypothetical protein [Sphingobacterium sp. UT-1RO-CII-1]|nr:hypothetical protein [Sphingobacterium sp. UT-1RO-CII-1]
MKKYRIEEREVYALHSCILGTTKIDESYNKYRKKIMLTVSIA